MTPDTYLELGPWERDSDVNWSPLPPLGQGSKPADWSHSDWPSGE